MTAGPVLTGLVRGELLEVRALDAAARAEHVDALPLGENHGSQPTERQDRAWLEAAACRGRPLSWWYDTDPLAQATAQLVCRGCPVRGQCLDAALVEECGVSRVHRFGVRGGLTPAQRARLSRRR